jgi:hypothetical protein
MLRVDCFPPRTNCFSPRQNVRERFFIRNVQPQSSSNWCRVSGFYTTGRLFLHRSSRAHAPVFRQEDAGGGTAILAVSSRAGSPYHNRKSFPTPSAYFSATVANDIGFSTSRRLSSIHKSLADMQLFSNGCTSPTCWHVCCFPYNGFMRTGV